jgi:hypothetical protein
VPPRTLVQLLTALLLVPLPEGVGATSSNLPSGHPTFGPARQASAALSAAPKVPAGPLVDLNSASRAQLKTLPGIGDAEAQRIIASRPYPSKFKLVADNVLSSAQFEPIRHRVVALQKIPPYKAGAASPKKADTPGKSSP